MNKNIIFNGVLWCLLVLVASTGIIEAKREYTKTYEQKYALTSDGQVELNNMHGQIAVSTWAKNEVQIKVTVTVNASSDSRAESAFDRINISFDHSESYVHAETEIDSRKSFWGFLDSWWGDDDLKVDYQVFMPETANLEIEHKYGNVEIEDISGEVAVSLKYGNLSMDHAAGKLTLDLAYGNGVVAKANQTTAEVAYFKLRINDANTLNIDSKYSKINVGSANEIISESAYDGYELGDIGILNNEGKYDKFDIRKLEELDIETKYTTINIDELTIGLDAELSYGGLSVDDIGNGFDHLTVQSRYTGLEFDLKAVSQYHVDLNGRYTGIQVPDDLTITREVRDGNNTEIKGYKQSDAGKGAIYVDAEYGGLKIR